MGRRKPRIAALYLVSEVARAFGMHPSNVRRLIHDGRLRAHRLGEKGSRWRIARADLEDFVRLTRIGGGWMARGLAVSTGNRL
jgi:excisionase family DNA binding protein